MVELETIRLEWCDYIMEKKILVRRYLKKLNKEEIKF
jgi:hypothetical protein